MPKVTLATKAGRLTGEGSGSLYASIREAVVYDEPNNRSVFALEIWDEQLANRRIKVGYRSHETGVTSTLADVGITGITDDNHGVPALCRDHEGYWHVFGASHITTVKYASTDAPEDLSAWTSKGAATELAGSYPHPVGVGDKVYLFYLRRNLSTDRGLKLRIFNASGGTLSPDGSSLSILDLDADGSGPDERVYLGNCLRVGTEIWFVASVATPDDTERKHVYFLRYDTVTGAVKNYAGTATVASGELPVDRAEADADFRIYEHEGDTTGTDIPVWLPGSDGLPCVFFSVGEDEGPFDVMMTAPDGEGGWDTEDSGVDVFGRFATYAPVLRRDGAILLYHNDASEAWSDPEFYPRGHVSLAMRSSDGTWGSPQRINTAIGKPIGRFTPGIDAHPSLRVLMTELAETEDDDDAADHRVFAHGARGFIPAV